MTADRDVFGIHAISTRSGDINLKEVLSYEFATVPYSLARSRESDTGASVL